MPRQAKADRILAVLAAEDTPKGMSGWELAEKTGFGPSALYSALELLAEDGAVEARRQDESPWPLTGRQAPIEPREGNRPRQTYYRITPDGHRGRAQRIAKAKRPSLAKGLLRPRPA